MAIGNGRKDKAAKLFLIEDNDFTRTMIKRILNQIDGFELIGEASDGENGITEVLRLQPDVVICDIGLPGCDGIEAVKQIKSKYPQIQAVMLTAHDADSELFRSFEAGAQAYLLKMNLTKERLELAVRSVEEGSVWLDPLMAAQILNAFMQRSLTTAGEPLTRREEDTLHAVAQTPAECPGGVCQVDPSFIAKLTRFSEARKALNGTSGMES